MPAPIPQEQAVARRANIVAAARWCFLNFGYAKTTLEDIATRANLSRTLLYRFFKDKAEIYHAVFADWLVSRRAAAMHAAEGSGNRRERLLAVCRLLVLEPWAEMITTPMGGEFLAICEQIDPQTDALYRELAHKCIALILRDETVAEIFLLALDGLVGDQPSAAVLEQRIQLLATVFANVRRKTGAQ